jgi:hypothetical protein
VTCKWIFSWYGCVKWRYIICRVKEQRNILHEIRKRKANWIGHILRRNCPLQRVTEGKIQGGIEVIGRQGRIRRKLLDDLKERRGYSHLKEETLDRTIWRGRFGRGFGPVVRQTTKWIKELFLLVEHLSWNFNGTRRTYVRTCLGRLVINAICQGMIIYYRRKYVHIAVVLTINVDMANLFNPLAYTAVRETAGLATEPSMSFAFNPWATNVIYIYGAPIPDVSRSHTTTHHSR